MREHARRRSRRARRSGCAVMRTRCVSGRARCRGTARQLVAACRSRGSATRASSRRQEHARVRVPQASARAAGSAAAGRARSPRRTSRFKLGRQRHSSPYVATGVSQWWYLRLRPFTMSKNAVWIFSVSGPRRAGADHAPVELADRRDLGGGAGEERLVADVDVVAREARLLDRDAEVRRRSTAPART